MCSTLSFAISITLFLLRPNRFTPSVIATNFRICEQFRQESATSFCTFFSIENSGAPDPTVQNTHARKILFLSKDTYYDFGHKAMRRTNHQLTQERHGTRDVNLLVLVEKGCCVVGKPQDQEVCVFLQLAHFGHLFRANGAKSWRRKPFGFRTSCLLSHRHGELEASPKCP